MGFGTMIGGGKNYREEIPDWFYAKCVEVRRVEHEEDIERYTPEFQEKKRLMNSLPLGSAIFFCTETGYKDTYGGRTWYEVEDWDTWLYWQRILMVQPGKEPQTSGRMFSQAPDCWVIGFQKDGSKRPDWRTEIANQDNPYAIFDGADA